MSMFQPDDDEGTLPPGVHSREAAERALEITRTQVPASALAKQAESKEAFLTAVQDPETKGLRKKWTPSEIRGYAPTEAWSYGWRHGHLDPGTIAAVGNLLLTGMSVTAARKALGITTRTWNTWMERGTGDEVGTQRPLTATPEEGGDPEPLPQSPYNVLVYVVENSQAIMELKAVKGWTAQFDRDWRAAQAFLVARNPDEWNPTTKTTVDTTSRVDVSIGQPAMDTVGLLEVARILQSQGVLPSTTRSIPAIPGELMPSVHDRTVEPDQDEFEEK